MNQISRYSCPASRFKGIYLDSFFFVAAAVSFTATRNSWSPAIITVCFPLLWLTLALDVNLIVCLSSVFPLSACCHDVVLADSPERLLQVSRLSSEMNLTNVQSVMWLLVGLQSHS